MQQVSEQSVADQLSQDMADRCLGVRVGRLNRMVSRTFERELRAVGLTLQQLEVLSTLNQLRRPAKPTLLADLLSLERSTVSRNLAVLHARGWVTSVDVSATGRSLAVDISPSGVAQLASAADAWREAQTALVNALGSGLAPVMDQWLTDLDRP